jgi:uncharacterized protein
MVPLLRLWPLQDGSLKGKPMASPSHPRQLLEQELRALGDEAMLIEEFDGFVAGLLVCPEMISPNEWLPRIWNRKGQTERSPLEDPDHANRLFGLIMNTYNDVVLTLMNRPEDYRALFPVDARNGDIIWEVWVEGFAALALRPAAWQKLLHVDREAANAVTGMLLLAEIVRGDHDLPQEDVDKLRDAAPSLIPDWVVTLHEWRLANTRTASVIERTASPPSAARGKVRRNEPCPCGSGKKYKGCCGLN